MLFPNCNISEISNITIIIARCVIQAIKNVYGIECNIKFPNDVMLNSRKIAGILTETKISNEIVREICVGIGININQTEFSDDVKNIATSLKLEYKKDFSREKIIAEFFNLLEYEYLNIIN